MSFGEAIKSVFSKYATFSGRARRSEYWFFFIFNLLVSFLLLIIDRLLIKVGCPFPIIYKGVSIGLVTIWALAVLIPSIAVTVRRLHDTGKSGWLYLPMFLLNIFSILADVRLLDTSTVIGIITLVLAIIYIVYSIIMLVWLCRDSDSDANRWGWNPKF